MWNAIICRHPPQSGEMPEHHFQEPAASSSRWLWLQFSSDEGDTWAGAFRAGPNIMVDKAAASGDQIVFVLAGGVCYVVNGSTRRLITSLAGDYTDFLPIPDTESVALADFTSVSIAGTDGVAWATRRIAWDGIRLLQATSTSVSGVAEAHDVEPESRFEIDLAGRAIRGGHLLCPGCSR